MEIKDSDTCYHIRKVADFMQITGEELAKRKERIILCSFQLFCKNGIENTTILDIAKLSKVAAASVYRYFGTKTELCIQAGEVMWHRLVDEITSPFIQSPEYIQKNGYDQMREHLHAFLLLYKNYPDYVQFMNDLDTYLFRKKETMSSERYKNMLVPVQKMIIAAIEKGQADGSIAARTGAEEMYPAIWGLMRNFVCRMVIGNNIMDKNNMLGEREFNIARDIILSALKHGI